MAEPTYVPSELTTTASEELIEQIDKEVLIPDPEDKDSALAKLIDENTEKHD
jgi:hypothetical protein